MTRLILSPFDPAAPGSYRQRMRMLELAEAYAQAQQAQQAGAESAENLTAVTRIARQVDAVLRPRLRTDDGTPVEAALDQLSADDYDLLVQGMFNGAGADNVPLASTPASTAGRAGRRARPSRPTPRSS